MNDINGIQQYFKEIGRHSVLTKEEEHDVFERLRQGDESARERIISCNLRLVVRMAQRFQNRGLSLEDLIQEGNIGLMEVIERFDHTLGFRFSTYAAFWIRQAIQVAVRKQGSLIRLPVRKTRHLGRMSEIVQEFQAVKGRAPSEAELAQGLQLSLDQVQDLARMNRTMLSLDAPLDEDGATLKDWLRDDRTPLPLQQSMRKQMADRVRLALRQLTPREHSILSLRFGLNGQGARSLRKVSTRIGLSQEGVRRVEQRALAKLGRQHMRGQLGGLL
jgi:RNA polymerase primary sigma factor